MRPLDLAPSPEAPPARPLRIMATGGGTGGHVYPALAILATARPAAILYVGTAGGLEAAIVSRAGLPFASIPAAPVRGQGPLGLAAALLTLARGLLAALRLVDRFQPDVILATGGYVCVPVVLGGWLRRRPALLFLPDAAPGLAVRFLARFARAVAVSTPAAARFLPAAKAVVTGYPVRPALRGRDPIAARRRLGIPAAERVLLVLGGSRGARALNDAVAGALPALLDLAVVIHSSGQGDFAALAARQAALPPAKRERYRLFAYLHDDDLFDALAAADLVVCRAGASVLGELPAAGRPAILVPYPYAGAHQEQNAAVLVEAGAAVRLSNTDLRAGGLLPLVQQLLQDPARLAAMAAAARRLDHPEAASRLAQLLQTLAQPEVAR